MVHLRRSDPTYEAWKHLIGVERVACKPGFRSYLRGMETETIRQILSGTKERSDPTYEAWKQR